MQDNFQCIYPIFRVISLFIPFVLKTILPADLFFTVLKINVTSVLINLPKKRFVRLNWFGFVKNKDFKCFYSLVRSSIFAIVFESVLDVIDVDTPEKFPSFNVVLASETHRSGKPKIKTCRKIFLHFALTFCFIMH